MSCSAFAIEVVDKEESAEVQKRVGAFRVALRKFVVATKLSDVRFEALVNAADVAWRPILPKPKARSVRDVLFEAFSAQNKADALDDYIIMFDEESLTCQALDAAPEYAQLSTVLQALIAVSRYDEPFCEAATSILASLGSSSAANPPPVVGLETAPTMSAAQESHTSTAKFDISWLEGRLQHGPTLISEAGKLPCGSFTSLLNQ